MKSNSQKVIPKKKEEPKKNPWALNVLLQIVQQWKSLKISSRFFVVVLIFASVLAGILSMNIDRQSPVLAKNEQDLKSFETYNNKLANYLYTPDIINPDSSVENVPLDSNSSSEVLVIPSDSIPTEVSGKNGIFRHKYELMDSLQYLGGRLLQRKKEEKILPRYQGSLNRFKEQVKELTQIEDADSRQVKLQMIRKTTDALYTNGLLLFETRKREEFAKKTSILFSLFFSCFAGLAFVFIDKNMNELIRDGKVKILNKGIDRSNHWLVWALIIWITGDLIELYLLNSGPSFIKNELGKHAIKSFLSTINSLFFILAMRDFDFKKIPSWKKKLLYKRLFGIKKDGEKETMVYIYGLAIFIFTFEVFLAWIQPEIPDIISVVCIQVPDNVFSIFTIILLGFHLTTAFAERGKGEYILLVFITLGLVFYVQIVPFIEDFLLKQNLNIVLAALYRISLISLFLFLSFSWLYFFRGLKLDERYNSIAEIKEELGHRLTGYLGNSIKHVENILKMDNRLRDTKQNIPFRNVLTEIRGHLSAYYDINVFIEDGGKDLYSLFIKFKYSYERIFSADTFSMTIDGGLKKLIANKEQVEDLGRILNELITNVSKHSNSGQEKWIKIEIGEVFGLGVRISVEDQNPFFDIEEAMEKTGQKKYSGLIDINERTKKTGGKVKNIESSLNGNIIIVDYQI